MKSSSTWEKKRELLKSKKIVIFLLVFIMFFSFLITPLNNTKAQMITSDPLLTAWQTGQGIWEKVTNSLKYLWQKSGSVAFQGVVRTALNKFAYDAATSLATGGTGQKKLFITEDWGAYLGKIGDEAAGQFIESFAANLARPMDKGCQESYQICAEKCEDDLNMLISNGKCELPLDEEYCISSYNGCYRSCKEDTINCDIDHTRNATSTASADYNNPSFNVCQPSSLEAKVKISLGLVEQQRPGAPNCTASEMIKNWGDEAQRLSDTKDPYFLGKFKDIFNPVSNDLGIYMSAKMDMLGQAEVKTEDSKLILSVSKGWKEKTNIAKEFLGVPGSSEATRDSANNLLNSNFGKVTGDIVVDAANVFLNQYAITKFKDLMSNLGEKAADSNNNIDLSNPNADPTIVYGEGKFKETISSIIKPDFGVEADYDILSKLSVCQDVKNPGPTDCVIDNRFMQGITEKRTVAEAIKSGYLYGNWQLTKNTEANSYSLRNIEILRKYRILPIGWEEAVKRIASSDVKATLMDLVSCFDPSDEYNQFSADFNTGNQNWCRALIDPNWVLKAPLNYCRKQGFGGQIINKMVIPSIPGNNGYPYTPSILNVTRAEEYCGDEQTCIKEKDDGSCEAYGYCNEEKRTWNFAAETCEPINNTCQQFTNASSGKNVSYLENTLNYGGCDASGVGCRQYSLFGLFSTSTGAVSWQTDKTIYLNKQAANCSSKNEACTELLRVKPTWGSNLVMDADYNNEEIGASSTAGNLLKDWYYWSSSNTINNTRIATIVDSGINPGNSSGKALRLQVSRNGVGDITLGILSNPSYSLLPDNFQLFPGQSYTLSADVYLAEGTSIYVYLGTSTDGFKKETTTLNKWQHLSVTRVAEGSFSEPVFGVNAVATSTAKFYLKNLKFELSEYETTYKLYGAYRVYEKIIPPYLEKSCYNNISSATKDYRLRGDAPAECLNFARKCNREEVGCESFTDVKNGLKVSAQTQSTDYCPRECVGYDVYISKEDYFNSPQAENILPQTASVCSAEAAGCSEFTNLDSLNQGGESKEYYSSLKQCIKPSTTECGSFYSWEGTNNGYQLRAYSLKKTVDNEPAVTAVDSTLCNVEIYNKSLGDPEYNADCREFYNSAGRVFYHLISRTITCSENCHAYRRSDKNIDQTITTQTDCISPGSSWDAAAGACYKCLNGGTWDDALKACIYQAIPGEGKTCSAAENKCLEYNGSDGNNVKILANFDFENGKQDWTANCVDGLPLTTISNDKNGHSLLYKADATNCSEVGTVASSSSTKLPVIKKVFASMEPVAQLNVGYSVKQGKSYTLRFIARASATTTPEIYFYNNDDVVANQKKAYFATSTLNIKGTGEWNIYQANLDNLDHEVTEKEMLIITASQSFYFDDVVLTEITDRYYLIKNSSQIPDICYYDISDNYQGADYNLGCSKYLDRANNEHDLRKFSKLCSDSAVGCEQVIATQNYTPYGQGIWNDINKNGVCDVTETDCLTVARDQAMYAVYDSGKKCDSSDLGCSRLGQAATDSNSWTDVYKKNNPNLYEGSLCSAGAVACEEWTTKNGAKSYFKDPGNEVCQYRASKDLTIIGKSWYKIPVKRCDLDANGKIEGAEKNGLVCVTNNDCSSTVNISCIIDNNDYPCSISYFKTFGLGGTGNQVPVPDQQAGLCESSAAGCTEYIDPVSRFTPNLVYNPGFENGGEGWSTALKQTINIEPNKLYILSTDYSTNTTTQPTVLNVTGSNYIKVLQNDNTLTSPASITIMPRVKQSIIFASLNNYQVTINSGELGKTISLKEAVVNYQLQENIDRDSCNGIVNFDNGCVLFNERKISGANGLVSNYFNAASSSDKAAPVNCDNTFGSCTANTLIKVRPNRVCAKWLDCVTYIQDPVTKEKTCYALGQCTRLNDKNECASFEEVPVSVMNFSGQNKNASGYYLLDKYHLSQMNEVGLNTEAHYDFEDSVPILSCHRAVDYSACLFNKNIVSDLLIREPDKSPTDYPAHGATYLKVPSAYYISPQTKDSWLSIKPDTAYYLNFLVNTKNSGQGARVVIDKQIATGTQGILWGNYDSPTGWSRKVVRFFSGASVRGGEDVLIKIYLGAATSTIDSAVYFDDINIEPVLSVGSNGGVDQYVARDCRLYPTNNSLTCVNKNNNVLQDGLEGYCLERDPNNQDVCLLWYPVDNISSAMTMRNSVGYQGKFPLNYCTEVNAHFDLVEKRVGAKIQDGDGSEGWDTDCAAWFPESGQCLGGPGGQNDNYYILGEGDDDSVRAGCFPRSQVLLPGTTVTRRYRDVGINCDGTYQDGWGIYDGFGTNNCAAGNCETYGKDGTKISWPEGYIGEVLNEGLIADPALRVYDYNKVPADEDGLKLLNSRDPEKAFYLTCNRFAQVVDNNGDNKAWSLRVGINSIYPSLTPAFFVDQDSWGNKIYYATSSPSSTHQISTYGRNRDDVPFGAATWPDSFSLLNSDPIKLRNQYSKINNQTVFAGRPYGCSGNSCNIIGQCSLDPNVYCILAGGDFNRLSCAGGGYGICVPLWKEKLETNVSGGKYDFKDILKTLFLKTYNSYYFDGTSYIQDVKGPYNFTDISSCINPNIRPLESKDYSVSPPIDNFCGVLPKIIPGSVKMRYNNQVLPGGPTFAISKKGVYSLEFLTKIDPEQQPLKEIYINWGDGTFQVINGQDSHSDPLNPHIFYHYYKTNNSTIVNIKITDNWGFTAQYE